MVLAAAARGSTAWQGMFIEFIGIPGAGKTTYADELVSQLRESGLNVTSYRELMQRRRGVYGCVRALLGLMYFTACNPRVLRIAFVPPRERGRYSPWWLSRAVKLYYVASRLWRARCLGRHVVVDQGPLQAINAWYVAGADVSGRRLRELLHILYPKGFPEEVVVVDVGLDVARNRLMLREATDGNDTDFGGLSEAAIAESLCEMAGFTEELTMRLVEHGVNIKRLSGQLSVGGSVFGWTNDAQV